jgi:hypothetical protein
MVDLDSDYFSEIIASSKWNTCLIHIGVGACCDISPEPEIPIGVVVIATLVVNR